MGDARKAVKHRGSLFMDGGVRVFAEHSGLWAGRSRVQQPEIAQLARTYEPLVERLYVVGAEIVGHRFLLAL
jgi:hypothetical protein